MTGATESDDRRVPDVDIDVVEEEEDEDDDLQFRMDGIFKKVK